MTLAFSTASVNIVIFIIYAYFQGEKETPHRVNRLFKKVQALRAKKKCDADGNKVAPSIKGEKNDVDVSECVQNNNEVNTLTYRRLSEILDHLFFVVYLTAIILMTTIFLISIIINFYNSD